MAGVIALAFSLRLGWGLWVDLDPSADLYGDPLWYHRAATELAAGRGYLSPYTGYPTATWPPGYPAILSVVYRLFGPRPLWSLIMNAVAGTLTCLVCWYAAAFVRKARDSQDAARAGACAACLVALAPSQIFFAPLVMAETVFTLMFVTLVVTAAHLVERLRAPAAWWRWLVWGCGVGGAALVRGEGLLLLAAPALVCVARSRIKDAARLFCLATLGAACVLAPWVYRNARVFGAFVPVSTHFGHILWIGHNSEADGSLSVPLVDVMSRHIAASDADGPEGELRQERRFRDLAIDFALTHPGRELHLTWQRLYHLFRGDHVWLSWYKVAPGTLAFTPRLRRLLVRLSNAYYVVLMLLAAAGGLSWMWAGVRRLDLVATVIILWSGAFALLYGDPRFHFPLLPLFAVLAASLYAERTAPSGSV